MSAHPTAREMAEQAYPHASVSNSAQVRLLYAEGIDAERARMAKHLWERAAYYRGVDDIGNSVSIALEAEADSIEGKPWIERR